MSLSLFSFQGETPNLCARKPYPRLYTGGRGGGGGGGGGGGVWRHGGDRERAKRVTEQETERAIEGKYSGEVT